MPNIKLTLEYDGTRYHGWQRQLNAPTVQGSLEEAVFKITKERLTVVGAGRTDAGVHAEGQTANFKTKARLAPDAWQRALNSKLPEDIVVVGAQKAPDRFHARFSAVGKIYRYRILNRRYPPAIGRQYIWAVYQPLNVRRMRAAAKVLMGRHDFSSFQGANHSSRTPLCRIHRLEIAKKNREIVVTIEADRFLKQMVRTIVGTLVEVGKGKRRPGEIKSVLQKKDRRCAGPTAPPQGLCLVKVKY